MARNRRWFAVSLSGLSIGCLGIFAAFLPLIGAYEALTIYIDLNPDVNAGGLIAYAAVGFLGGLAGTGILGLLFEIHEDLSAIRENSVGRLQNGSLQFSGRRANDPLSKIDTGGPPENIDDGR